MLFLSNFLTVQSLINSFKRTNILQHGLSFSCETLQSMKQQNEGRKKSFGSTKGQSEKYEHITGIVTQSVLCAYRKITTGVEERKQTPSVYTLKAFPFVCRSIAKLLDKKITGLCQ